MTRNLIYDVYDIIFGKNFRSLTSAASSDR